MHATLYQYLCMSILNKKKKKKIKKNKKKKMESKFPVDMRIYTLCPSYLQSFTKL